jgi:PAS domain S-box-containing protein
MDIDQPRHEDKIDLSGCQMALGHASKMRKAFLLRLNNALRPLSDPAEVQAEASRLLGEHLGVNRASYAEIQGEYAVILRQYVQGVDPLPGIFPCKAFGEALMASYQRGETVAAADIEIDSIFSEAEKAYYRAARIAAFAGAMLVKEGRWAAAFVAQSSAPRAWSQGELELIREVAERTWAAVERARTEAALRESGHNFRAIFQTSTSIMTISTLSEGRYIDVNEGFTKLTGYTHQEVVGRKASEVGVWADLEERSRLLEHLILNGQLDDVEITLKTKAGDHRAALFSAVIMDIAGERCIVTSAKDITYRKLAEEAIQKSEEQKRLALEAAQSGTWEYNPLTRESFWDQRTREMFGISPHENVDMSKYLSLVHPEDRGRISDGIAAVLDPSTASDRLETQYRILLPGGEVRWISANGKRYTNVEGSERKVVRVVGTNTDITKHKRDEEERKTAVEFLRLMNESRNTEDLVRKAIDFISKESGCEAVGIRLKKEHDCPYYEVRGSGHGFVIRESRFCSHEKSGLKCLDNSGETLLECICGTVICGQFDPADPFFTARGSFWANSASEFSARTEGGLRTNAKNRCNCASYEALALIALRFGDERLGLLQLSDTRKGFFNLELITFWERLADYLSIALSKLVAEEKLEQRVADRTALAESRSRQLQSLAVELIEAEERERQRIADLLHEDLQQLLAAARFTLLSKRRSDPDLNEVQRLLEESISKSRRLSHELSPPVLHHSGLSASLEWLCLYMREQFGLNVHLCTETTRPVDQAPIRVFLFRAVQELLFNIVKHSGVDTAHVKVAESDDDLIITVSDLGKGFDTSMLETYTLSAGLGLLSLRERSSHIGGSMVIQSAPGQGSRVTLKFPVKLGKAAQGVLPALADENIPQIPLSTKMEAGSLDIRVLFADDHRVMRQGLIRLVAGKPNISVIGEAANGLEALDLTRRLRPDVVIMDISMPEMDGIEATRKIKGELPDVRVIGLSMHEDEQVSMAMRGAGAEEFLSKAVSSAELLNAIYEVARDRQEGTPASSKRANSRQPTQLNFPWYR